jgi:hypothetical protein
MGGGLGEVRAMREKARGHELEVKVVRVCVFRLGIRGVVRECGSQGIHLRRGQFGSKLGSGRCNLGLRVSSYRHLFSRRDHGAMMPSTLKLLVAVGRWLLLAAGC